MGCHQPRIQLNRVLERSHSLIGMTSLRERRAERHEDRRIVGGRAQKLAIDAGRIVEPTRGTSPRRPFSSGLPRPPPALPVQPRRAQAWRSSARSERIHLVPLAGIVREGITRSDHAHTLRRARVARPPAGLAFVRDTAGFAVLLRHASVSASPTVSSSTASRRTAVQP